MFEFPAAGGSQYQEEVCFAEILIGVLIAGEVQTPLITSSQNQEVETILGKTWWPAA
jgi:hypothetical protein